MSNYRKVADKQDNRVGKNTGWRTEVNSGAVKGRKGDLKTDDLLVETKTKVQYSDSIKILENWFDKLQEQAFAMGKAFSILVVSFGDGRDYAVLPERTLNRLVDPNVEILLRETEYTNQSKEARKSTSLYKSDFNDLELDMQLAGKKYGALSFNFGSPVIYTAMSLEQFKELYDKYKKLQCGGYQNADTRDFNECDA